MKKGSGRAKVAVLVCVAALAGGAAVTGLIGCNKEAPPDSGIVVNKPVNVTVESGAGGSASVDKQSYISGDNVGLTITPDTGFELDKVTVGGADRTLSVRDGYLSIENVTEDTAISVTFKARETSVVSYKVNGTGGTATLSATSGYVGDKVTLTVAPEAGYEVMTVKVNGGDNLANALTDNSIDIELTTATVEIEIEFFAFPIKATVVCGEGGSAVITSPKDTYKIGDIIEIVVTPQEDWFLSSLLVNGAERKNDVAGGKLSLTLETAGNINFSVRFDVTPAQIDFAVTADKFGEALDLEGVSVELKHESGRKYTDIVIAEDGKIVADVIPGKYTVTVDNFIPFEIVVAKDGFDTAQTLTYQPFAESVVWNTSSFTEGKINNSAYGHLLAKDNFDNFVFTLTLKKTTVRTSVNFKYGNKMIGFSNDGNKAGLWLPGTEWGNIPWSDTTYETPSTDWYENDFANTKDDGEVVSFNAEYKFVRQGTKLYLFVEDTYVTSWEIFTADQKVNIALTGWGSGEIPVNISADTDTVNGLVGSNVTVGTVTNGDVTLDKTDGKYTLGDEVTVNLTPKAEEANAKYVLESLTLDGEPVSLDRVHTGVFTFKISKKAHTVSATFKSVAIANIDVAVTATKFGETQSLSEVVLSNANYNSVHRLNGGKLQVSGLAEGTYTVSAGGYIPVNITVSVNGSSTTANLVYNPFATSNDWTVTADSENNISISSASAGFHHLFLKDAQGDFALTYNIKKIATKEERRLAFTVKYGDNKMLAFTNVWNNDYGMSIPTGDWNIVWDGASHTYTGDWRTLEFTETEKAAYNGDSGINVSIVRQGATLYVFFGERFVSRYELFDATEKVECAFTGWSLFNDNDEPFIIPVTVKTDDVTISNFTESTISVQTAINGTLTLDKTNGKYFKGDNVTLTITPDTHSDSNKKYVLSSLTIDGQSVNVESITGGNYSFTATKANHTVAAEFTEVNLTMSLDITVTAEKHGAAQTLTAVTLKGENYEQTHNLAGGKLTVSVPFGSYTLTADGYIPVTVNSETTSVKLAYDLFTHKDDWTISSQDGVATVATSGYNYIELKDDYGNFVVSGTFAHTADMDGNKWAQGAAFVFKVNTPDGDRVLGFQLVGSVIKTIGAFEGTPNVQNAASWDQYTLTQEQQDNYHASALTYTIVRSGKYFYLYLDGVHCRTMDFGEFDNNATTKITIAKWDGNSEEQIPVTVSTQESDVTAWVNKAS